MFIGSLNLDPRSVVENTEIGLLIESREIAARMGKWFGLVSRRAAFELSLAADARHRLQWRRQDDAAGVETFVREPHSGFWRRLGVRLLRLLPIESQL